MELAKHHYALSALGVRNSTRKIARLRKEKPEGWEHRVEHERDKLRKHGGTLKILAQKLNKKDRDEAYWVLQEDPVVSQKVIRYQGRVIGKRVTRESGEIEDVIPEEYLSPMVSEGVIIADQTTYERLKEREQWILET